MHKKNIGSSKLHTLTIVMRLINFLLIFCTHIKNTSATYLGVLLLIGFRVDLKITIPVMNENTNQVYINSQYRLNEKTTSGISHKAREVMTLKDLAVYIILKLKLYLQDMTYNEISSKSPLRLGRLLEMLWKGETSCCLDFLYPSYKNLTVNCIQSDGFYQHFIIRIHLGNVQLQ